MTITSWNIEYLIFFVVLVMICWVSITVYNYTKKNTPQTLINNESVIVKDEIIPNNKSLSENSHLEQENVKNEHDMLHQFDNGYEKNRLFEKSNENKEEIIINSSTGFQFGSNDKKRNNSLLQNTEVSNYNEISSEPFLSYDSRNESDINTKNTNQSSIELQKSENEIQEVTKTYFTVRNKKYTKHEILYQTSADNKKDDIDVLNVLNEIELENTENTKFSNDGNNKELDDFNTSSSVESLSSTVHNHSTTDIQFVEDVSDVNFYNINTSVDPMNDAFIHLEE